MRRSLLVFGVFVIGLLMIANSALAEWTQFRGPNGTGISKAKDLPTTWSETSNVVWKTPIHDKGWSSPVVLGNQVWVTTATEDGKKLYALGLDTQTGKILHDIKVFEHEKVPYTFIKDYNSHASPSPVIEEGRVYVHFGSSGTACIDTETGKILWKRTDLPCNHWRAPGSSPILHKDLLILTFDGYDQQYLTALDKKTGETKWKTDRTFKYKDDNGDLRKGYSTPALFEIAGKMQLISTGAGGTISYDPDSGTEIWKVLTLGTMNASAPPLYGNGLVYVTTAYQGRLLAIKPDGKGDVTGTHVPFEYKKEVPSRPSVLLVDDLLFMVNDTGIANCIEAKTGKPVWSKRITGNYSASPVLSEGKIYVFDHEGKGHVLKADRSGEILATNKLEAGCRATPALVGNAMYVRTLKHLYRIEKK